MNIFDGFSDEQLQEFLSQGQDRGLSQQQRPSVWQPNTQSIAQLQPPEMPTPPNLFQPGDVSGFANAGMQAPPLPDPAGQMRGLMSFMGDPHQNSKEDKFQGAPKGGLMSYLQTLGV